MKRKIGLQPVVKKINAICVETVEKYLYLLLG
jgi:hypothetical protein